MQNFKNKIYFAESAELANSFSENDCIILYEHIKESFTIYKFEDNYILKYNHSQSLMRLPF